MIILSAGLPKSGSAWYFRITNEAVQAAGFQDANEIKERFNLHNILKFGTCNIQEPTSEKIRLLTTPPIDNYTFAVKTHFPPNSTLLNYMAQGRIKTTFIFRDPRDMAVSGYEAGQKLRKTGRRDLFAKLTNVKEAIYWAETWLKRSWEKWRVAEGVLFVRYEDLLAHPMVELKRLCEFMNFNLDPTTLDQILDKWSADRVKSAPKQILHFNKGTSGRYRTAMGPGELKLCRERLGPYLKDMGYKN